MPALIGTALEALINLWHLLPSPTGNIALDVALVLVLALLAAPTAGRVPSRLYNIRQRRAELADSLTTLELKTRDVAAVRQAFLDMRHDIDEQCKRMAEDDAKRLRLAHIAQLREIDPEHAELEEQLQRASLRSAQRFDV